MGACLCRIAVWFIVGVAVVVVIFGVLIVEGKL